MANKKKVSEPSKVEQNVGEVLSKTDQFIENNLKTIIITVVAVIVLVVAVIGVRHAYYLPKNIEAQEAMFQGENYFAMNQWETALNGDSLNYMGFLSVIDDYGFTTTGKLAQAYAGLCYYQLGQPEAALEHLKKYKGDNQLFSANVLATIGDCYVDLDDTKQGIEYFKKAAKKANNQFTSPIFLKKAATAYESLGDYKSALAMYQEIKKSYPQSEAGLSVDKYIIRAENQLK